MRSSHVFNKSKTLDGLKPLKVNQSPSQCLVSHTLLVSLSELLVPLLVSELDSSGNRSSVQREAADGV